MKRRSTHPLRRARRKRRSQCTACAYDLSATASPVCPECGTANEPRSK